MKLDLLCAAMLILFFCILLLAFCGKRICITGSPLFLSVPSCHFMYALQIAHIRYINIYIYYIIWIAFSFLSNEKKIFFSWFTWWNITYMYMYIDVYRWSINKKKTSVYRNAIICCFVFNTSNSCIVSILNLAPKYEHKNDVI